MEIKIKDKTSRRRIYFEDLNIGDIFKGRGNICIVVHRMIKEYDEYDEGVINAINLSDGEILYFEDEEVVEKYMGEVLELEDKFNGWI